MANAAMSIAAGVSLIADSFALSNSLLKLFNSPPVRSARVLWKRDIGRVRVVVCCGGRGREGNL